MISEKSDTIWEEIRMREDEGVEGPNIKKTQNELESQFCDQLITGSEDGKDE